MRGRGQQRHPDFLRLRCGRPAHQLQHHNAGDSIAALAYTHDILGDLTTRSEQLGASSPGPSDDLYQYDLTRQLTHATYGHKDTAADAADHFSYDPLGNRQTWTLTNPSGSQTSEQTHYTTNNLNQYTELENTQGNDQQPEYDTRGNLVEFQTPQAALTSQPIPTNFVTNQLRYDADNRLRVIENDEWKITQVRDARNRVIHRKLEEKDNSGGWAFQESTTFIWDNWSLIEERTTQADGNELMRRYVHGPRLDEIIRQETFAAGDPDEADSPTGDDPTVIYPHHDHLGSVIALTDAQGQAVEFVRYSAFGQPTLHQATATGNLGPPIPTSAHGNRHLYTGREWLREASLADHRNRTYSPHLGRWTSTDPIQFEAGDVNLYRYVGNGIIGEIDLWGLETLKITLKRDSADYFAIYGTLEIEGTGNSEIDDCCGLPLSYQVIENPDGVTQAQGSDQSWRRPYNSPGSKEPDLLPASTTSPSALAQAVGLNLPINVSELGLNQDDYNKAMSTSFSPGGGPIRIHAGINAVWSAGCPIIGQNNFVPTVVDDSKRNNFPDVPYGQGNYLVPGFDIRESILSQIQFNMGVACAQRRAVELNTSLTIEFKTEGGRPQRPQNLAPPIPISPTNPNTCNWTSAFQ